MTTEELNETIKKIINSPENMQEFADLLSPEDNWRRIDKDIKVPSHIGFGGGDCPYCFDYIRLIYDKFSTTTHTLPLTCPHCKEKLKCKVEFTGYTSEVYLEEI